MYTHIRQSPIDPSSPTSPCRPKALLDHSYHSYHLPYPIDLFPYELAFSCVVTVPNAVASLQVSSYIKFCTSYSNPLGLGRIFPHLVPLFTFPLLTDVYNTSIIDIMMLITMESFSLPPLSHFHHFALPECPS